MLGAAVTAVLFLSAGGAQAQGEGLLSLLDGPSITLACFPAGQVGQGNTFTGTQNISCSQSAAQSNPAPSTPAGNGVTGAQIVHSNPVSVPPGTTAFASAYCPTGKIATGGGYDINEHSENVTVTFSGPGDTNADNRADAWGVYATNNGTDPNVNVTAYAICANDGGA
ncbi:hypothetical protein ACFU7Y_30590 [Kitasatospora sp. NPDC057542]|uniref:hypothetical protein n=1 Tax=Streptomycetaceae TaxID=2062 RepID=UPI001CC9BBFC|nr:hypothetical protein [Streptomyces sp. LS1784]